MKKGTMMKRSQEWPGARPEMPVPVAGLATWLRRVCERYPDRVALTCDDIHWQYGELQRRVERMAAVLLQGGVGPGDRVGYLGFNDPMFLVALFASARLGAIFVPLNFRLTGPEAAFVARDAGVHTLLCDAAHRSVIDGVRSELPCRRWLAVGGEQAAGWELVPALDRPCGDVPTEVSAAYDDVAVIMYTSGTTGTPKGAMLTHGNFWTQNLATQYLLGLSWSDVVQNFAPLFHIGGLCCVTLPGLQAGAHLVLHRGWDAAQALKAIEQYRITVSFAVPSMLIFLSQHPDFERADLSSLRSIAVGGAPMPEALLTQYAERGIPVHQAYGMTETTATITFLNPDRASDKLGSCGTQAPLTEVRLADSAGRTITEPHTRGEICARGPNVMKGYWNCPNDTAASFDDEGWFHTGDVGYVDEQGFLYLCDRLKDMIISGGENVYPAEVESVLYRHPAIAEVAVIGAPDKDWGERVVAVVVIKPGASLALEELQTFTRESLAGYKIPRELRCLDALPRTPTGKVLKGTLRAADRT